MTFGAQQIDISYGRQTDGLLPWVFFTVATPGASNNPSDLPEGPQAAQQPLVYPNPATGNALHFRDKFTGRIFNMAGQVAWSGTEVRTADISTLPAGIYIVSDIYGNTTRLVRMKQRQ